MLLLLLLLQIMSDVNNQRKLRLRSTTNYADQSSTDEDSEMNAHKEDISDYESESSYQPTDMSSEEEEGEEGEELSDAISEDLEVEDNCSDDDGNTSEYSLYNERDDEYVLENFEYVEQEVEPKSRISRKRTKTRSLPDHVIDSDSDIEENSPQIRRKRIQANVIYDSSDNSDNDRESDNSDDSFTYESAHSSMDEENATYEWEPIPIIEYGKIEKDFVSKLSREDREEREREKFLKGSNQAECKTPSPERHGVDYRMDEHYMSWETLNV